MNFYDKIHELVRSLKETIEYTDYINLKNDLKKDEKTYQLIKNFKGKQGELQLSYINGKEIDKNTELEMQNMYSIIMQDEKARRLFENEMKLNVMIADIQKILGEGIKELIEF
ncbi:MAG: YlbF family regulator [Clostridia bacterium]|nr:YlbF family regulator [Clostridia bacterium]